MELKNTIKELWELNLSVVKQFRKGKEGINEIEKVLGWDTFLIGEARKRLNFMLLIFMRFRSEYETGIDKFLFLDILDYFNTGFFIYLEMETFPKLDLGNILLHGATFKNCHFWRPNISNSTFYDCFFGGCDFTNGKIENSVFLETRLSNTAFLDCELRDNSFTRCSYLLSNFDTSSVLRNDFEECDISDSTFKDCGLFNSFFTGGDMINVEYENCDLSLAKISRINTQGCSIVSCYISGAEIENKHLYDIKTEYKYIPFYPMDNIPSPTRTFDEIEEELIAIE